MTKLNLLLFLLPIQFAILILMLFVLIIERSWSYLKKKSHAKKIDHLKELIFQQINHHAPKLHEILKYKKNPFILLEAIDSVNKKVKGGNWEFIKKTIVEEKLLHHARKYANSFFIKKRLFSARCFSLFCHKTDLKTVYVFLEDRSFLVQVEAAETLINICDEKGIKKVLDKSERANNYTRMCFRDFFIQAPDEVFAYLDSLLDSCSEKLKEQLLDILSGKKFPLHSKVVDEAFYSDKRELKHAALLLHAKNPQKGSFEILKLALSSANSSDKILACEGLSHFKTKSSTHLLSDHLDDKDWFVSLEAAKSLKKIGELGESILKKEEHSSSQRRRELASYMKYFFGEKA